MRSYSNMFLIVGSVFEVFPTSIMGDYLFKMTHNQTGNENFLWTSCCCRILEYVFYETAKYSEMLM